MSQLLQSLRRLATSGGDRSVAPAPRGADDAEPAASRLPSTVEQLDAAAPLIEGLGQLRQISLRQGEAMAPRPDTRAEATVDAAGRAPWRRAFALQAWMEEHAKKAQRRSSRSLVQRLERALAPLAYPG